MSYHKSQLYRCKYSSLDIQTLYMCGLLGAMVHVEGNPENGIK